MVVAEHRVRKQRRDDSAGREDRRGAAADLRDLALLLTQGLDAERVDPFLKVRHITRMARRADKSSLSARLVAPNGSADRITTYPRRSDKEKAADYQGFHAKRLKGLEPSTFCMASRRSSQLSYSRAGAEYSPPGRGAGGGR